MAQGLAGYTHAEILLIMGHRAAGSRRYSGISTVTSDTQGMTWSYFPRFMSIKMMSLRPSLLRRLRRLATLSSDVKNRALLKMADGLQKEAEFFKENEKDWHLARRRGFPHA